MYADSYSQPQSYHKRGITFEFTWDISLTKDHRLNTCIASADGAQIVRLIMEYQPSSIAGLVILGSLQKEGELQTYARRSLVLSLFVEA